MSSRRGVFLVLTLILFAIALSTGALLVLALLAGAPPSIPANASLFLRIQAPFSEIEPLNVLSPLLTEPPTLRDTLDAIQKAKRDSRIKTLVIEPEAQGALWGQLDEVRAALEDFRSSGKPLTAYLESGGAGEYYLASAANRIVMMPAGQLDLAGLATYELFFRGTLDKIGVYPDLLHIGDYKTASNTFTQKGYTAAHKEMSQSLNHDWYQQLVSAIATARKRSEADVEHIIDGGPYMADEAKAAGLVDSLGYEDQIDDTAPVLGTQEIDGDAYAKISVPAPLPAPGARIALLYAVGTIASGKSAFDTPSGLVLGSDTFVEWVRKVRVDPTIRAIVVRIDSPGGSAIASDVIWRELELARAVKPVVVSMGDVAASGGYYIAVPADTIVAEPGTITGSIGVVTGKFVVKGTLDKLGVGTGSVSDGKFADIYSPFRPFSDAERARVEAQLHTTYELFLSRVADGRHSTPGKIDQIAQGRVWTGRQAHDLGLVDELGGLATAIRIAARRAKLDPSKPVQLVVYPPKRSLFDLLSNPLRSSVAAGLDLFVRQPGVRVMPPAWSGANLVQSALSTLSLFRRGEPLAIMPNVFLQ
jgi:protease IV